MKISTPGAWFFGVCLLLFSAAAAGAAHPLHDADVENGEQRYNETCVACHGENGRSDLPGVPSFRSATGPLAKPDKVLIRSIIEGFESPNSEMAMPALGGNPELTRKDAVDVLAFIRRQFGG